GILIFLAGIYFAYTRAAYLAVIAMCAAYFIINFKAMKITIISSIVAVIFIFNFITTENYYLKYSPSVKTVSQHELSDIIDATLKGTDVSSMERIYRWIAAIHMVNDRPITGFGPNGFVPNYKNYTVFIFETWISENEEQSGVHNYFLMTLVEQGIAGLLIFVSLLIAFFVFAENLYHNFKEKELKATTKAIMLSMVAIVVSLVFSDMIEVDKTGSLFFINLALIVLVSRNFKPLLKQ
ncbi:MAG: O-antigen ligase, partial [Planctomycetota bacterium]